MSEEIFRKKSLDKIKSPESLNDYVRVANPGVWLLLAAVIMLLIGITVWSVFGWVKSIAHAEGEVINGTATCTLKAEDAENVTVGTSVRMGKSDGEITAIEKTEEGQYLLTLKMEKPLEDGIYSAQVILEKIRPISFILN